MYKWMRKPERDNLLASVLASMIISGAFFFLFGLITLGESFMSWYETGAYFIRKGNPQVRIIGRALGGGAYDSDRPVNHVVLSRPFLHYFVMETKVDTTTIDRSVWEKP